MYLMQNILYCRRLLNFPLRMEETETSHHCTGKQAGWAICVKTKTRKEVTDKQKNKCCSQA